MRRAALFASLFLASCSLVGTSHAFSAGIIGFSGKTPGVFCSQVGCHSGGVEPTVHFEGPTQLEINQMATFRFVVQSNSPLQVAGGLDVSTSSGTLAIVANQGERLKSNEITHEMPKPNDANGVASFDFTFKAPATAGTVTLFGAGNSANLDTLSTSGDRGATTTLTLTIVGALPATPTPTPTTAEPTPTATPTPTTGTAPCVGDCGGDGEVTVNELIIGVNIAVGSAPVTMCTVLDVNGDGEVTIDEILRAVNNALNGCPV